MTYSKIHQRFSERLNKPEALTNPEKYLGPNYQDVLNFWIYLDTLSYEETDKMCQRYCTLDYTVRQSAIITARHTAEEVVGWGLRIDACLAAWDVTGSENFGYATYELIAHHKILEQGKTPLALQYCIKP